MAASKKGIKKATKKHTSKTSKAITKKAIKKVKPKKKGLKEVRALVMEAASEKTTLDTLYIVDDTNKQVTLEVNVGAEEQTSDMTIMFDGIAIVVNHSGDLTETILGTNDQLNGKKLNIVANIADTSKITNLTSLSIHLRGGVSPGDFPLNKTVDEEGDSEDYICLIEFFNPLL